MKLQRETLVDSNASDQGRTEGVHNATSNESPSSVATRKYSLQHSALLPKDFRLEYRGIKNSKPDSNRVAFRLVALAN